MGVLKMSKNFNLDNYETVKSRKKKFYAEYKDGRIIVELIENTDSRTVFKSSIYKNSEDQQNNLPLSIGHALEIKGQGYVNKTSWLENCEESAIGRALDNGGFCSNDKCSREEMIQAENNKQNGKPQIEKPTQGQLNDLTIYAEKAGRDINSKGFIDFKESASKSAVLKMIEALKKETAEKDRK